MAQPSLNSPCPCGSGKKFKRCCGASGRNQPGLRTTLQGLVAAAVSAYEQGEMANAGRMIDQALALAPTDPAILGIKGMVLFRLGRLDEAARHIERAIAGSPKDSRLHNFHGQVLREHANSAQKLEAERAFGRAVSLDPGFVEAWYNLGRLQLSINNPHEAIQSFRHALRYAPKDGELHFLLAKAHYLARELTAAAAAIEQAATCGIDPIKAMLWRSMILRATGATVEADAIEHRALAMAPPEAGSYPLMLDLSQNEMNAGNLAESERWLLQALDLNQDDLAAYFGLAMVHKFDKGDLTRIKRMERFLAEDQNVDRRRLQFVLGKVYSDLGEHDRSFEHYKAGNDLMRARVPFDAAAWAGRFDSIIAQSPAERLAALAPGSDSSLPILIVGTPRSGTTLAEQIISSHSWVAGAGEMDFWGRIGPGLMASYNPNQASQIAEHYLAHLLRHAGSAQHVTDKQPLNYEELGVFHAVFPNARIVHCRRHPIDACLSIYFQDFDDTQAYKCDQEGLVAFYEQYQRLMAHWRAVLPPGTMYELQYEALVDDLEGETKKLMDFLGLDWEPQQAEFYKQDRSVFTPSKWQVRQPIYKTSKERWRRYEKHLGPLLELMKYAPA
ncbi:MAG: sulfotransferase [Gallionellaceae bacterium]|nr:sulfotransferase [Gallionellaceae bacterium]